MYIQCNSGIKTTRDCSQTGPIPGMVLIPKQDFMCNSRLYHTISNLLILRWSYTCISGWSYGRILHCIDHPMVMSDAVELHVLYMYMQSSLSSHTARSPYR